MRQWPNGRHALLLLALIAVAWAARAQELGGEAPRPVSTPGVSAEHPSGLPGTEREDVARFRQRVDAILAEPENERSFWGVLVADAGTGEILYVHNPARHFVPASNAKLFTTAMALATLGTDFRIYTRVLGMGALESGRLRGDLVLLGAGDANLSNRVFPYVKPYVKEVERDGPPEKILAELADQVVAQGVKQIEGDIVADDSYFERGRFPSGWTVDDTVWGYGAAVSAIAVNDNTVTLEVRPGPAVSAPLRVSLEPWSGLYEVRTQAVTSAAGSEAQLELSREPESRVFYLRGTLPLDAPPRPLVVAVQEPAEHAAALLARLLEARGVRINGRSRARHSGETAPAPAPGDSEALVLAENVSPPLLEDVRLTNKISLNLHAELMLRVAAREKVGALTPDDALEFAEQFRQSVGLEPADVLLTDGSGLSRNNLVTPQAVVQWLAWAVGQAWGADFRATLPVAGEDGTLESRMKGTAAAGRVQAKTGLVDHAGALSGYATSLRGARLIFSMFSNNNGTGSRSANATMNAICVAMVEELGPAPATPPISLENRSLP